MNSDRRNDKSNRNFMVQGTILAAASIVVRLIGMVYRIPLTNIVGDEGMGLYSCAFEVYNIALLLSSYSLPLAVSKLVAARIAKGQKRNAERVFKCAMLFGLCAGAIIGLIVFFGSSFIASRIMKSPMSVYALRVLAPCLFVVAVMGVVRGFFQGQGTMIPTAISQIIEQIVNAVISVVAAYYLFRAGTAAAQASAGSTENANLLGPAYGAAGGTLGTICGAAAGLIFLLFVLALYRKSIKRQVKRDKTATTESYSRIFKLLFMTIVPVVLSSALYNICGILDQAIFNHMMSTRGVPYEEYNRLIGMYSGKFLLLVNVPLAMSNALASSSIPSLTASVAMKEKKAVIYHKIHTAIRFSMLVAIPSFVGFLTLASPILQLLWHDKRAQMATILMVGAVCVVFYSLSTITNAILQGLNHMRDPLKNACISLVIHIALLFIMLNLNLGIYAVVIANVLFSLVMCILNQRDIHKVIGYRQEKNVTFIKPFIAAAIMGVIARLVYFFLRFIMGNSIATIICLFVAVFVYAAALILLKGLTEEDILSFPKGEKIAGFFRKIRLLR